MLLRRILLVYGLGLAVLNVWAFIAVLEEVEASSRASTILEFVKDFLTIVAIVAFSLNARLWRVSFWRIWFVVTVTYLVGHEIQFGYLHHNLFEVHREAALRNLQLSVFLKFVPLAVLYMYAYRSRRIWMPRTSGRAGQKHL